MTPIIHVQCGGIAFYCDHTPIAGETMKAEYYRYSGGRIPNAHGDMVCESCMGLVQRPTGETLRLAETKV